MSAFHSPINRRNALRGIGAIAVGGALTPPALLEAAPQEHPTPTLTTRPFTNKPVTCIISYEGRMKAMREGPYGRCVYHSDNDVVDHQVLSLEFARERTASFTMTAFTTGSRRTRVMCTMGEAIGDSRYLTVSNIHTGKQATIDTSLAETDITSGHGGGDYGLMKLFIKATQHQDSSVIASSLKVSIESHRIAFEAERSRLEKRTIML